MELNSIFFSKIKETLELEFNQKPTVKEPGSFTITLTQRLNDTTTEIKFIPARIEGKKVIFELTLPEDGIENGTLTINSTASPNIASERSPLNLFIDFPKKVEEVYMYKNEAIQSAAESAGSGLSKLLIFQNIFLTLISIPFALLIVQLFQIIDFIGLINIELPVNVKAFIEYFDQNILTLWKNPLVFDEDITRCQVHEIFTEYDISCITFNNMGIFLVELVILLVTRVFLVLALALASCLILNKGPGIMNLPKSFRKRSFSQNVLFFLYAMKDFLSLEFFSMFVMGSQLDALMGAFTGLQYGDQENRETSVNYLLACLVVFVYSVYFLFLLGLTIKTYRMACRRAEEEVKKGEIQGKEAVVGAGGTNIPEDTHLPVDRNTPEGIGSGIQAEKESEKEETKDKKEEKVSTWDFFFEEIKQESPLTVFVVPMMMFQDLVMAPIIIFNVNSPKWQIIPLVIIYVIVFAFLLYKRPFKSTIEGSVTTINVGFYLATLVCLWYLSTGSGQKMLEKDRYNYIGNFMISLISLAVLSNAILAFIPLLMEVKNLITRKKKPTKKEENGKEVEVIDKIGGTEMLNSNKRGLVDRKKNQGRWMGKSPKIVLGGVKAKIDKLGENQGPVGDDKTAGFRGQTDNSLKDKESEVADLNLGDPFGFEGEQPRPKKIKKVKSSPDLGADLENIQKMELQKGRKGKKDRVRDLWDLNLDDEVGNEIEKGEGGLDRMEGRGADFQISEVGLLSKSKKPIARKFKGQEFRGKRGQSRRGARKSDLEKIKKKKKRDQIFENELEGGQKEGKDLDVWDLSG